MSWQWADEPSHIAPETGPNLLTGTGPWTAALEPGQEYVLTVDVLGTADTLVEWQVSVTDSDGEVLEYPAEGETVPGGEWVTVTRPLTAPAFEASASVALTAAAETRAPSLAALTGRMVLTVPGDVLAETIMASGGIVAGTPGGARVELTDEGLVAFDTDGTETAQIRGAGGEFVGGVFRTSDALPGQVTLSDTANQGAPGIAVEPDDSTGYDVLPSIGPGPTDMWISGGVATDGTMSGANFNANGTSIYHNGPGASGTGSWVIVNGDEARLAYRPDRTNIFHESGVWVRPSNALVFSENEDGVGQIRASGNGATVSHYPVGGQGDRFSRVSATSTEAMLSMGAEDSITRRLRVDGSGVWVDVETGPHTHNYTSHNLLETAQDSGWQAITPATGYQNAGGGASFEYRRMGRMIHLRGRVSATSGVLTAGTAHTIGTLPAGVRPAHTHRTIIAGGSTSAWGRIDISGGTGALSVAPISANMNWVDLAGTMWTVD